MSHNAGANQALSPEHEHRLLRVRAASRLLRHLSADVRNRVLERLAQLLTTHQESILSANQNDLSALSTETTSAFKDRLTLTPQRLDGMKESLSQIARLNDPLGEIIEQKTLANGLSLRRVRSPLGVILMIFEARPNVITEAFSLAFKSGNAIILRGGSESMATSRELYRVIGLALDAEPGLGDCLWGVTDSSRALSQSLMKQIRYIDVLVPRGGDRLIEYVTQNATIPIIKNDRGMCHIFIDASADEKMAIEIVRNAKTQRPGVCNSAETVLVHSDQLALLPALYRALEPSHVEWFGCPQTLSALGKNKNVRPATDESFDTEYLDFKLNCRVVDSLDEALDHIEKHGSRHSESIVTKNEANARRFQNTIDAAVVYWNASTRFTDGFEFGLGGELGISTQKLHVRGPVGLKELTSVRWLADGSGQTRG